VWICGWMLTGWGLDGLAKIERDCCPCKKEQTNMKEINLFEPPIMQILPFWEISLLNLFKPKQ